MFQRAKSFIIRRKKDADHELELPDSSHLVRRPVTANMQDRINVRAIQKNTVVKPNVDFNTLRMKSTSLEDVSIPQTVLQKKPMVLSSDGLDTIRRKKEQQKKMEQVQKTPRSNSSVKPHMTQKINVIEEPRKKKSDIIEEQKKEVQREVTRSASQKTKLFRVSSRRNKKNQDSHDQRNEFIFVKMADK